MNIPEKLNLRKIAVLALMLLIAFPYFACYKQLKKSIEFEIRVYTGSEEISDDYNFLRERLYRYLQKEDSRDSVPQMNMYIGEMDTLVLRKAYLFNALLATDPMSINTASMVLLSNVREDLKRDAIPRFVKFSSGDIDIVVLGVLSEQFHPASAPESIFKSDIIREIEKADFRILLAYIAEGELRNILMQKPPFDLIIWKPLFNRKRYDWIQEGILIVSAGKGLPYLTRLSIRLPGERPYHFVNLKALKEDIDRIKIRLDELSDGEFRNFKPDQWAKNEQDYKEAMDLENQLKILSEEIINIPCAYSKSLIPLFEISRRKRGLGKEG